MNKKAINWEAMNGWKQSSPPRTGPTDSQGYTQSLSVSNLKNKKQAPKVASKFTDKDRKHLVETAKPFIPEDYENIVLNSSRVLIAATYDKENFHKTKTEKGYESVRYVGQVIVVSLDEKADLELDWSLASSIAVVGQLDSDRAWIPLFGVIEAFSNLLTVDGRQVFYTPNKHLEETSSYRYNLYSRDLCYIAEWTPQKTWFEDHWTRPSMHSFQNIYDTAKRFVYEPLGEDIDE